MKIFSSLKEWRAFRRTDFFANKKIGLVTTMGNLHAGHQSLLERSVRENSFTVLTLFINPTQFNNPEDLKHYPRTLDEDLVLAKSLKVDFVLTPTYEELYPDHYRYKVTESVESKILCGKSRPGHFDGVLTVVLKLLQCVKADQAYFGEKDFQQLQLISGMVEAFFLDTKIIPCVTIRDKNGLALSSRNNRLSKEAYQLALNFPKLLGAEKSISEIISELSDLGIKVDYIEEHGGRRFGAVFVGDVRLIDNIETEEF
jgi:pantoate--beta-alanine ligase